MPVDHYENFPVASILLPRRLRGPVETIYRFARAADDLADEGNAASDARLDALAAFDAQLDRLERGASIADGAEPRLFATLGETIRQHGLPFGLFHDLVSAFRQDVTVLRYEDEAALLDYSRRSANPIGRLMLLLFGDDDERHRLQSDRVCTSLQLINFWQDVAIDLKKDGRMYLPRVDREAFGVDERALIAEPAETARTPEWRGLMRHLVERARAMMREGAPLATAMPGRIGLELRFVVQGGLRILEKIERVNYDVVSHRPVLTKADGPLLAMRAFTMRS